nr:hypothetical protein [Pleurocapsa sp. MO_192.B19]
RTKRCKLGIVIVELGDIRYLIYEINLLLADLTACIYLSSFFLKWTNGIKKITTNTLLDFW